ncbi:MAG: YqhA family protein [Azonexus sp.]|jgi:uncharacterized membrane protein YqhA|uniref:YqhA family protein n=1 Tax=Azonexus sp. TaxID=1872668 RepID=UPI0028305248|nr:YqhA family protein [Azonexus sp.]MDR0776576.1 YqhA family protein [Azonexus sp.]
MLRKLVSLSRFVIAIPFFFTLLFALFLIIYESASVVRAIFRFGAIFDPSVGSVKAVAISIIEGIDVYLIAIGAYIISMGLYSLFIDDDAPLPKWLQIRDLEDLKRNLMSVIIAVLAVLFLKEVFAWDGSRDILSFGLAISAIIVSLVFFMAKLHVLKGDK